MTTVTLKMPDDMANGLALLATRRRASRSEILRQALKRYIGDDAPGDAAPSAFDRLASLSGSVQGPADLSAHPRHLKGYGK
ncbi:MAG: Ribbon-helix-helix protein, copG family [Verrucomicrobia bacterium ADurb.Bin070]|nr:MAG: Ribbon-helix-helix protein, copG family [Verrucomicrobia bacterium ADurb.Bin070]